MESEPQSIFDININIEFNIENILRVMTYSTELKSSYIAKFRKKILSHLYSEIQKIRELEEKLRILYEDFSSKEINTDDDALKRAIATDIDRILNAKDTYSKIIDNYNLSENIRKIVRTFEQDLDIQLDDIKIYIVDKYPEPYSRSKAIAIAFDQGDYEKYGIEPGIWIRKNGIRPLYTEYIISHELVHKIAEKSNPHAIGRGLEEGLAMLYGSLHILSKVIGEDIAKNILFYDYFYYPQRKSSALYRDYFMQAVILYKMFGIEFIRELVRRGREYIAKIESTIYKSNIKYKMIEHDINLDRIIDKILIHPYNLVVSPLAYVVANNLELGVELNIIRDKLKIIENEMLNNALNELCRELNLCRYYNNKITALADYAIPSVRYLIEES